MKKQFEVIVNDYNSGFITLFEMVYKVDCIINQILDELTEDDDPSDIEVIQEEQRAFVIGFITRCHTMVEKMLEEE